jgi:rhamnose transport system substrate-binding protein
MKRSLILMMAIIAVVAVVPAFAGGQAEAEGDQMYRVGVIPKFIAEDYFIAAENGFRQAERELGNVVVDWVGDTMSQTSAANQQNYIQSFVDRGYDAILVSALDPESYASTLRQAREEGILVVTWDADVNPSARDWFVNQGEFDEIGIATLRGIAGDLLGHGDGRAPVALVSTTPDSPNQNAWLQAIIREYESKRDSDYSHLELMRAPDEIVYAGNDQGTADGVIRALLSANPDIEGIIALSSNTVPAVSSARDQMGIGSEIKIVGISVPETSRGDMEAGNMSAVVLWQPFDLGYLTLQLTVAVLEGNAPTGDRYVSPLSGTNMTVSFVDGSVEDYPSDGHKILANNEVILGPPIVWNLNNIDRFRGYPTVDHGMEHFLD